jgi:hypothetical protein
MIELETGVDVLPTLDQKVIELETGVDVLPTLDQKVKCSCKVM